MQRSLIKSINNLVQSLNTDPLTLKKAILLCFYAEGLRFMAELLFALFKLDIGLIPDILYMAAVLVIAWGMGKGELSRIFAWRNLPLPVFAGAVIMFFVVEIIKSELHNLLQMALPVPESFFDGWFYEPGNVFLLFVSSALFPAFTEEIFFRGIIARRFFRSCTPRKAILLSAALFGIMHLNPWQSVNAFYAGIFLGWMYWRYKSIWLCMFIHAYHNILVSYMTYPYVEIENSGFRELWRHPLWFDLLGLLFFGLGLLTVIALSRKKEGAEKR
jgi:membrane protease YdiL (CAAX protease family)